jgi:hypothetical protein
MNKALRESKRKTILFLLLLILMTTTLLIITPVTVLLQMMSLEKKLLKMHQAKMFHSYLLSKHMGQIVENRATWMILQSLQSNK